MNVGATPPTNRNQLRGTNISCAELQELLRRDAATATEWLVRRRFRGSTDDQVAQRKRVLAYIEWCGAAADALQESELLDYPDFHREWRMQALRSDIREMPHRFAWVFASQVLFAISIMLFVAGLPAMAIPLLAGAVFGGLHVYLAVPSVIVGPDSARVCRADSDFRVRGA
ncbi:hypothetical protein [Mycolicibacterium pulveris]|uniref:hypothetical protein n=1 Tax=Mycolicibacterium pulveris TaxID=36813 RepID=UPI003CF66826